MPNGITPGVEALRAEEMQNLDLALCHALEQSIAFVREKGNPLDPDTVAALDDARAACTDKGAGTAFCGCAVTE